MSKKNGMNPSTPNYNPSALRWQSTYAMQTIGPLSLPPTSGAPPGLWTPIGAPITAGYGYGYPFGAQQMNRFGPPPPIPPHSNYCCMANRHQCGHTFDNNGWPTSGPGSCWSNHGDIAPTRHSPSNGVAITEVKDDPKEGSDDTKDDSSTDSETKEREKKTKKTIKQLKQTNKELNSSLKETKQRLKDTEETLLKMKEKMTFDTLEYYRNNLRTYGSYIRQEVNRFYQNEEMAQKLKPIVEQISNASHHIKEEKLKTTQSILTTRQELKDEKKPDLNVNTFSPQSLPDFPNLLSFYKSILDEIPLIFLNDLSQLKRMANNFIQTKNKMSNSVSTSLANSLANTLPFGDESIPSLKPLSSGTNTLFSAPNISDLPKPDFNTLPLKPAETPEPPALELNFPQNLSPIPLPDSIIDESVTSTPLLDIMINEKTKEKPISPIGKPFQPMIDLKAICAENLKNNLQKNITPPTIEESFRPKPMDFKLDTDPIRAPFNPIPRFAKQKQIQQQQPPPEPVIVEEAPKAPLNQAQSRLLVKLREKYPQMSDNHLIESMAQTKSVLIASGNPKGFSGMKVADIINRISDYIDSKVLSNNFTKPRFTEMKNSTQTNANSIVEKMANTSIASKKAWNTLDNKKGKLDDSICSICFEPISQVNKFETECKHYYHHSCINDWIRTDGSCPICRRLVLPPGEFPEL